jgi:hypothetical protein
MPETSVNMPTLRVNMAPTLSFPPTHRAKKRLGHTLSGILHALETMALPFSHGSVSIIELSDVMLQFVTSRRCASRDARVGGRKKFSQNESDSEKSC